MLTNISIVSTKFQMACDPQKGGIIYQHSLQVSILLLIFVAQIIKTVIFINCLLKLSEDVTVSGE